MEAIDKLKQERNEMMKEYDLKIWEAESLYRKESIYVVTHHSWGPGKSPMASNTKLARFKTLEQAKWYIMSEGYTEKEDHRWFKRDVYTKKCPFYTISIN
jgi:hypothetical protein